MNLILSPVINVVAALLKYRAKSPLKIVLKIISGLELQPIYVICSTMTYLSIGTIYKNECLGHQKDHSCLVSKISL